MAPVNLDLHNDFSGHLVQKGFVLSNRNHFCSVRTHFYYDVSACEWFCDRRVTELLLLFVSRGIMNSLETVGERAKFSSRHFSLDGVVSGFV